jgi:hypothetical protein
MKGERLRPLPFFVRHLNAMSMSALFRCERFGREVEPERLWALNASLPADGHVERRVCVVCAARPDGSCSCSRAAAMPTRSKSRSRRAMRPRRTESPGSLIRGIIYGLIALAAFALVTWLSS